MAQKRKRERLTAEELHITDRAGKVRAILECDSDGSPSLRFYDEAGSDRLVIGLAATEHPGITLRQANGASLVSLGEFDGDRVGILVFDQAGEVAFTMVVHPDGTRHISCHDQTGKVAWQIQPPYQV